jgi:hypothetical protein
LHDEAGSLRASRSEEEFEGQADPHAAWNDMVCRAIGRLLHSHYQGHDWCVWVDRRAGIAKIWINVLMNPQYPYVLKLTELLQPGDVMRAGGEILERYQIPRGNVDFALMAEVRKKLGPLADRRKPPGGLIKG